MNKTELIRHKILVEDQLARQLVIWRFQGKKIVFTNGCFDLLHLGHVDYLSRAAGLGQKLVIGLNSDASVSRLKGLQRPITDQFSRAMVLASLLFVDAVVIFDEDTPYRLIGLVQPDILVKGGDYQAGEVVGADITRARGGETVILPFIEGYSTTAIEEKIFHLKSKRD